LAQNVFALLRNIILLFEFVKFNHILDLLPFNLVEISLGLQNLDVALSALIQLVSYALKHLFLDLGLFSQLQLFD
jgi:hypothetical protein